MTSGPMICCITHGLLISNLAYANVVLEERIFQKHIRFFFRLSLIYLLFSDVEIVPSYLLIFPLKT